MDNLTEKLNNFTSLVLKDAEEKRDKLMESVEKEYKERLEEYETEFLKDAYEDIQKNKQAAQKEANEEILHAQMEAKKQLIKKREEIISAVMNEARDRLVEFSKSDSYAQWLIKTLKNALSEVGEGSKIVYISPDDAGIKNQLTNIPEASDFAVEVSDDQNFTGGLKVLNTDRKVSVDYSFKELLSEGRQKFLQSSGLSLD